MRLRALLQVSLLSSLIYGACVLILLVLAVEASMVAKAMHLCGQKQYLYW
jgi:hypothetical protein